MFEFHSPVVDFGPASQWSGWPWITTQSGFHSKCSLRTFEDFISFYGEKRLPAAFARHHYSHQQRQRCYSSASDPFQKKDSNLKEAHRDESICSGARRAICEPRSMFTDLKGRFAVTSCDPRAKESDRCWNLECATLRWRMRRGVGRTEPTRN